MDNLDQKVIETLAWYQHIGVDESIGMEPESKAVSASDLIAKMTAETQAVAPKQSTAQAKKVPLGMATASEDARKIAASCQDLDALRKAMEEFEGCALKATASNLVFGDGNPESRIMFIGEAPGEHEDLQGKPFVGETGQLFDKMLSCIGLNSRDQFYVTNLVNWRPPGNRNPSDSEIAILEPFLMRHIELVNPSIIFFIGGVSAKKLLNEKQGITRLRGKWFEFKTDQMEKEIPAMPMLHPAYLLRQVSQKRNAWNDLIEAKKKMIELGLMK